jgi:formyltetrahydrofolate-dependent phosphoribosylglycinamide formyltransferase
VAFELISTFAGASRVSRAALIDRTGFAIADRSMLRKTPLQLAVLLSGSGRTLQNLIGHIADGRLRARIAAVVSSRAEVLGVARARQAGLETLVVPRKRYETDEAYSRVVNALLERTPVDLVILAGYMHLFRVAEPYRGRVLNIHPALLPDFGGPGMYGDRVHRAVLEAGAKESGCTVHLVDDQYDHGAIILQRKVPVLPKDTAQTLAQRVFYEECRAYPEAIKLFAEHRITVRDGKVEIEEPEDAET